jgi:flagellar biogenesis protein FliO
MRLAALKVVLLLKKSSKGFHVVTKFLCQLYFILCLILVTFYVVVKFE